MGNVELLPARGASGWRKISLGSWRITGDSSIYCTFEAPLGRFLATRPAGITINHFFALALARAVAQVPACNAMVRFGRIYPRKNVDLFFHALVDWHSGENLSGIRLEKVDTKTLEEVGAEFRGKLAQLRGSDDADFATIKGLFAWTPGWLSRLLLDLSGLLLYAFNLSGRWLQTPKDAFSGIMVTNLGTFGIEQAFTPIAPYTRVAMVAALGRAQPQPRVVNGAVRVEQMMKVGFTFDHRLVDGFHIGELFAALRHYFENPEQLYGARQMSAVRTARCGEPTCTDDRVPTMHISAG